MGAHAYFLNKLHLLKRHNKLSPVTNSESYRNKPGLVSGLSSAPRKITDNLYFCILCVYGGGAFIFKVKFHSDTSSREAERHSHILSCTNFKCLEEPLGVLHTITSEEPYERRKVEFKKHLFSSPNPKRSSCFPDWFYPSNYRLQ